MSGISPKCFGSPAWTFLHMISFGYPETIIDNKFYEDYSLKGIDIKKNVYSFFENLSVVIPCKECRLHYKQNFKNLDKHLDSRQDLIKWVYDLHELVNKQVGNKGITMQELYDIYQPLLTNSCSEDNYDSKSIGTCKDNGFYCKVTLLKNGTENFTDKVENNDNFYYVLIIVILILIICFLGYKLLSNNNPKKIYKKL